MTTKSIHTLLKSSFQNSSREDWNKAAASETKENNPLEKFKWSISEGLHFFPIYNQNDLNELKYLNAFDLRPCSDNISNRSWSNLQNVVISDELTANKSALDYLGLSSDGILFDVKLIAPDLDKLLNGIEWPYCSLCFKIKAVDKFSQSIINYIRKNNYKPHQLNGVMFWDEVPKNIIELSEELNQQNKIYYLGTIIEASSPVNEIASALIKAVNIIDDVTEKGLPVNLALGNIAFSISIGSDIFLEIAKLKALRMLWFQVSQAYQIKDYTPASLHIHARSEVFAEEKMQPHGNMLKSTASALASVMGGCDSLTLLVEDDNNSMMNRIAINVSNILREESHFNKVADPVAGSYILETMIDALAKEAWRMFQQQVNATKSLATVKDLI